MTETIRLAKYHGLGNDFLVATDALPPGVDPAELARRVCDRHRGVGADGLLLCTVGGPDGADLTMVLHNADGSRAEMSGNGIRCLVHAAIDAGLVAGPGPWPERPDPTTFEPRRVEVGVHTDAGRRVVTAFRHGRDLNTPAATHLSSEVDMGSLEEITVPDAEPFRALGAEELLGVSAGNPHVVLRFADRDGLDKAADEVARTTPTANVELLAPGPDHGRVVMRVIERGVGETLACGTGSCAAALAARRWGLADDHVIVHQPGGDASVTLDGEHASLAGPSVFVATVEVPVG